jgi:hypothetical protein
MSLARGPALSLAAALFSFIILQLLALSSVDAEWQLVDGNDKAKVYVDSETITRGGEWVRAWVMDDLKTAQMRGFRKYLSSRAQEEHDYAKERFRLLALEYFSENMGSGEALHKTSGESDWAPIPRGTLAQSVWKFLCGKRL